jgi:ABC-type multidrug transport system fused ATPase/permease subunit
MFMKNKEKGHTIIQNVIHLLGMAFKHYKIVFFFIILEMICNGLLPLFGLYLPKLAVELVLENFGLGRAMFTLGIFSAAYVLIQCVNSIASNGKYPFQNNIRYIYTRALFEKALECDYSIMETSEGQTWYEKARSSVNNGDQSATSQMFDAAARFISILISFAFIFGVISNLSLYIVLLLIILSAVNYFLDVSAEQYEEKQWNIFGDLRKKRAYMERAMAETGAAKDIRVYNLKFLFDNINNSLLKRTFHYLTKVKNRYFSAGSLKRVVALCRDTAAYAYCIWQVVNKNITIPDFVLYMSAITAFSGWMNNIIINVITLKRENKRLNDLRAFFEYTNKLDPDNPLPVSAVTAPVEIEFKNVGFRYTEDTPKILGGLSFQIRPGEKAALVGVNGAGKTTIVKLLCGFYKVSEGEILLNGHNIDKFRRADLYTLFSAVFQDVCILPVTAGENVSFAKNTESDSEKLLYCLEIAGIKDEIMKHDKKADTLMLKAIDENGIMLSGGETQKLLLARAIYKDAPILILDEPTAALDPIAESEVYEKFHDVTANKTALYISHRLASTRFCDKILLLKDGRIIESGSHDELIAKNGEYAYIFEIQSHYYKKEGEAV